MDKFSKSIAIYFISICLSACNSHHDVQYYLDNPDEMSAQIAKCNKTPSLSTSPECENASTASMEAMNASIQRALKQD